MFASKARVFLRLSTFQVLHTRVGSWPYPQTLDKAGAVCHGQINTLNSLWTLVNYRRKEFYNIGTSYSQNYSQTSQVGASCIAEQLYFWKLTMIKWYVVNHRHFRLWFLFQVQNVGDNRRISDIRRRRSLCRHLEGYRKTNPDQKIRNQPWARTSGQARRHHRRIKRDRAQRRHRGGQTRSKHFDHCQVERKAGSSEATNLWPSGVNLMKRFLLYWLLFFLKLVELTWSTQPDKKSE